MTGEALRSEERLEVELEASPSAVLGAMEEAASLWGADWRPEGSGGRLVLPVSAGLRHGIVLARVEVSPRERGSAVSLAIQEDRRRLRGSAVVVLLLGAAGGMAVALWPFWPPLLAVAPAAAALALAAWLLVVSRLRVGGPEEFLELVRSVADGASPPEG